MNRRKLLSGLSVTALGGVLAAVAPTAPAFGQSATPTVRVASFRIGTAMTDRHPVGLGAIRMAEALQERSNGRIKVDVYNAAQLGGELDMLSQIRLGSLDMAMITSGLVASIEPTFSLTEFPFIWKSDVAARQVLDGPIGQNLLSLLENKGIKGLAWGELGFRGILATSRPVQKPDDLKGLKIRVVENPLYVQTLRAFGANPVPMSWPEVYTGLDQGTIDAVDTNYSGMFDSKLYEVSKNLAVTDHIYTGLVVLMNLKKFQELPKDLQAAVQEAAKAGGERTRETARGANNEAIKFMETKGVRVTHPDRGAFEARVPDVYKRFAAQVPQNLIDEVKAAQK
jgi:TRAP-type transport system periplasmic protein